MGEIVQAENEILVGRQHAGVIDALPDRSSPRDVELGLRELAFAGAWISDEDPFKIGLDNFADIQNFRYANNGIEGTSGYTRLNTTALTNIRLRNGIHFIKDINGSPVSHVLVQAWDSGLTAAAVYENLTAIPSAGDFETTALHTDASEFGLGRFSLAPDSNVVYCNQAESLIWGSDEHRVASVINYDDPSETFLYDITERMTNTLQNTPNAFTLVDESGGGSDIWLYIGSVRPIQGIKFYVDTANTTASTSTVEYWNGSAWTAVTTFADGTASGGVTLAQTGTMSFDATESVAHVRLIEEQLLYFYRVDIGATGTPDVTIKIYHVTVDAPMQNIIDIWDGVKRTPIKFVYEDVAGTVGTFDHTFEILTESTIQGTTLAADLIQLDSVDFLYIGFEERITSITFKMLTEQTAVTTMTVNYWNGTAWTATTGLEDGTSVSGASLAQTGTVFWNAPSASLEFKQTLYGTTGYFYQVVFNVSLTCTQAELWLDTITAIPAQRWNLNDPIQGYRFPFRYQDRVMLANTAHSNECNRIDYSSTGRPDVWNGEDSSGREQQIYIGGDDALVAAIELTNRFGSTFDSMAVVCKTRETWLLTGNAPEDFRSFRVSDVIGCIAPMTLTIAEVNFAIDTQVVRTIALWVSASGPFMFDGGALVPMRFLQPDRRISGIDPYFDPNDSRYITIGSMENARGWYDNVYGEYNLLLPTASSTTCNVWLCCDMRRRKWFRKVPTTYPQMAFIVADANGRTYPYSGQDTGHLLRLEFGNTWDDGNAGAIAHVVQTGDLTLTGSMWDETEVRYIKTSVVTASGDAETLSIAHSPDGTDTYTQVDTLGITGTGRWQRTTQPVNLQASSHQFQLSVSTDDKPREPRVIGMAIAYRFVRQELS